jgi:hypothetical protein
VQLFTSGRSVRKDAPVFSFINQEAMKFEKNWKFKSLDSLEKTNWPLDDTTNLIRRVTSLRKVPLNEFTTEDLRLMIGQDVSLDYLIPVALERLEEYAFIEGDFYEGDLLVGVTRIDSQFWVDNPEYKNRIDQIISKNISEIRNRGLETDLFLVRKKFK